MSRIGRKPITVPTGVTVELSGQNVEVKGPKGNLSYTLLPDVKVEQTEGVLRVTSDNGPAYGLSRTLIDNMVTGVSTGFTRALEINGVGYRAAITGRAITLSLGYSHPIVFTLPEGIEAKVEKNVITLTGYDKPLLGQVAADIRALRKPEPYKGKGIKYVEERIRRKAGKTATKG
jgi:large subunit ribosomal protein L6